LERIHPDIDAAFAEITAEKQDAPARDPKAELRNGCGR